jgi:predicted nicotinamide N-methyase
VAYEIEGDLEMIRNCHCSRCRKARSAAHASNLFPDPKGFRWTEGEELLESFKLPEAKRFTSCFCRVCGSSLPRVGPGYVVVPAGTLDDDPGVREGLHIFCGSIVTGDPAEGRIFMPAGCLDDDPGTRPLAHLFVASKGDDVDLEAECRELHELEAPPYWAFCWGSGQALARFLLDHPAEVRHRRVVDLGTGSGVVAIAAAKAGARSVLAIDTDPEALAAVRINAALNHVCVEVAERLPDAWDVVLASDILYESEHRDWLLELARGSPRVLVSDPEFEPFPTSTRPCGPQRSSGSLREHL